MNIFIQGMRRSGTTILYDAFLEDPGLRCFYEPFCLGKVTIGGGSGAREMDLFSDARAMRKEFQSSRYPSLDLELFNWGGPRDPDVELEARLPEHGRGYLRYLLDSAPEVLVKEVRMYQKIPDLAELDPGAAFVHVVRDPRAVVASHCLAGGASVRTVSLPRTPSSKTAPRASCGRASGSRSCCCNAPSTPISKTRPTS